MFDKRRFESRVRKEKNQSNAEIGADEQIKNYDSLLMKTKQCVKLMWAVGLGTNRPLEFNCSEYMRLHFVFSAASERSRKLRELKRETNNRNSFANSLFVQVSKRAIGLASNVEHVVLLYD